jgi:HK97 family phage portal protein
MRHSGQQLGFVQVMLPATDLDYETEVGDGLGSSVLAAPLNWMMRTFPEAPPIVERLRKEEWNSVTDHALLRLLSRPNPFYGGRTLWMATVLDFAWGEAFWIKIRNRSDEVIQLWWVPRTTMQPKWPNDGGKTYIDHYEYRPGAGGKEDIAVRDVVHFRFGVDPRNTRRGLSQLGALWREVATDDQAANFAASILRNLGVLGVVISPKEAGTVGNKEAVKEVKEYIQNHFTGDKRGEALALGAPTDVNLLQYNMQGFDTSPIRDLSEERVCAALGIPAAVVGFGTGLQQTKVGATMKELRQLAWTGGIIPMQEIIADEVDRSLIPEFEAGRENRFRLRFDTSKVRALWEDANEKHDRIRKDVLASIITPMQAQQLLGYPIDEDRDVYLQPVNLIQLPDGTVGGIQPQSPGGTDNDNAED